MMSELLTLMVNGAEHTLDAAHDDTLLAVLREQLDLTGAKISCAEGACGACTVLLDGRAVRSCVTPLSDAAGRDILTIEGLATYDQRPTTNDQRKLSLAPGTEGDLDRRSSFVVGLSSEPLHPLQQAFIDEGAFQCGYCTPGMIMAAAGLLAENPAPDEAAIVATMQGNICRCGMYARVVRAVLRAAPALRTAQNTGGQP